MSQRFNMRVGAEALIVRDDAILLVEYGNGWKRHFNLPGGGIEPGESIVDGLRRELREETCAEITVGSLLLALEYFPPHFDFAAPLALHKAAPAQALQVHRHAALRGAHNVDQVADVALTLQKHEDNVQALPDAVT